MVVNKEVDEEGDKYEKRDDEVDVDSVVAVLVEVEEGVMDDNVVINLELE